VQGLRSRGMIDDVIIGSAPFLVTMLVMLAILSYWPDLALWLPRAAAD
jgi:C4-dicarboxylate transporter DctM subunit